MKKWNNNQPIYRQLRDEFVERILDRSFQEGEMLPSNRKVCAEYRLNPVTVSNAFKALLDENIVESKRGVGVYVKVGALASLQAQERQHFLNEVWPDIVKQSQLLGLDLKELIQESSSMTALEQKQKPEDKA